MKTLFFWSSTKIRRKIPLSLVLHGFDIVTANFLAGRGPLMLRDSRRRPQAIKGWETTAPDYLTMLQLPL